MGNGKRSETSRGLGTPRYRAWLLRRWAGQGTGDLAGANWRYCLEDPHTGARRGFASLADLVAYLRAEPGKDEVAPRPTG